MPFISATGQALDVLPAGQIVTALPTNGGSASIEVSNMAVYTPAQFIEVARSTNGKACSAGPYLQDRPIRVNAGAFRIEYLMGARVVGTLPNTGTSNISHCGQGVVNFTATTFKGNTLFQETLDIPCGVNAVQIGIASEAADVSSYTGVKVYVQSTDGSGGGANLQNPYINSVAQTMKAVTFNNGAASPTFVAGTVDNPNYIWSDITPVVNTGLLAPSALIVRQYYPSGVANGAGYGKVDLYGGRAAVVNAQGGKSFYGSLVGADVGANNNVTFSVSGAAIPVLLRLSTSQKITSIVTVGDSTTQGWKADGSVSAEERIARARSAAGLPTSSTNLAAQGNPTSVYRARLERFAASGQQADILIYQLASPNNDGGTITAASSAQMLADAAAAVRCAVLMGARLIFKGPLPFTAGTPSAGLQSCLNDMKNFGIAMASQQPNVSYVSMDELHDPTAFGKWLAIYNASADSLHENELAVTRFIRPNLEAAITAALR